MQGCLPPAPMTRTQGIRGRAGRRWQPRGRILGAIMNVDAGRPIGEAEDPWPICDHCGLRIPHFRSLVPRAEARVRQLIRDGLSVQAAQELSAFVGCDPGLAQLWVEHRGRPIPVVPGLPCPFCGERLATTLARQCLACGADWHEA